MALQFYRTENYDCRIGTGIDGYAIVYPFSGTYPGTTPKYAVFYHTATMGGSKTLGQFDTLADAQAACENHFASLPP